MDTPASAGVFQSLSEMLERCTKEGICSLCLKELQASNAEEVRKHMTKHWNSKIAIRGEGFTLDLSKLTIDCIHYNGNLFAHYNYFIH